MRRSTALVLIAIAVATAAGASQPATSASARQFRTTIYFLTDGETAPLGVRRTVERTGFGPLARPALQQLLAGPSAQERSDGLTSAIPQGVTIRSLTIVQHEHPGSTATVDLEGLPNLNHVNGVTIARIGTQIARTLIGVSDIVSVRIESHGKPWNFWLMSGGISTRAWDYQLLTGIWVGNFKALP